MRKECWNYIREKRHLIAGLCASLLLLGLAGMVLLPHMIQQWSRDRQIGVLHVMAGILLGAAGLTILFMLYKQIAKGRGQTWKQNLLHLFLWYLLLQLVSGVIQGGIGLLLYQTGTMSYERTKTVLYIAAGVWQNLLRVWFLFLMVESLYERKWRTDRRVIVQAEAAAMLLSVITIALSVQHSGIWQNTVKVVWEVCFLTGFSIYFGIRQRRKREI